MICTVAAAAVGSDNRIRIADCRVDGPRWLGRPARRRCTPRPLGAGMGCTTGPGLCSAMISPHALFVGLFASCLRLVDGLLTSGRRRRRAASRYYGAVGQKRNSFVFAGELTGDVHEVLRRANAHAEFGVAPVAELAMVEQALDGDQALADGDDALLHALAVGEDVDSGVSTALP